MLLKELVREMKAQGVRAWRVSEWDPQGRRWRRSGLSEGDREEGATELKPADLAELKRRQTAAADEVRAMRPARRVALAPWG